MTYLEYAIFNKYWFFSAHLSVFEHPTYFSMKIIWVLQLLMILHKALKINNTITILTSIFLSVFLFFTASRAAIIFWLIIVFYYIIKVYVKYNKIRFIVILTIPAIIFLVFISLEKNGRINDSISELETKLSDNNFHWKNLDQRTREWYNSMQLIKKEPLTGVGFVMVNERMKEEYYKNGFYEEANLNLNAHNQFLEAQMTFGIAGTLSLLLMLLTPLVFRKRLRYPHLTTGFILMFSFFLMFESMFNRQWGIMFFLLFYFILSVPNPEKEDNIAPDRPLL
jgi:O-antigen ligase